MLIHPLAAHPGADPANAPDLVAYLHALTGTRFLTDARFGCPDGICSPSS